MRGGSDGRGEGVIYLTDAMGPALSRSYLYGPNGWRYLWSSSGWEVGTGNIG
jgi:hypothetical protein